MQSSGLQQICMQNLTATHVTLWTNVMDRQIGAVLLFRPDRRTGGLLDSHRLLLQRLHYETSNEA